jgi:hypothetical protein
MLYVSGNEIKGKLRRNVVRRYGGASAVYGKIEKGFRMKLKSVGSLIGIWGFELFWEFEIFLKLVKTFVLL